MIAIICDLAKVNLKLCSVNFRMLMENRVTWFYKDLEIFLFAETSQCLVLT
ncbi:hypothetical protein EOD39_15981 [Acipenser ruthenus]|uniref:Uncharacterized protein n=1 Tax=Acipenser ruthenus TaxID=7906 RepID=A0A444V729_ACIRT|nr:hypothetical protein EOD39_15981 [Acipenser ruthenus]